ncbi:hypothetical protein AAVH_27654, partial [Aphelenchoides avenae]
MRATDIWLDVLQFLPVLNVRRMMYVSRFLFNLVEHTRTNSAAFGHWTMAAISPRMLQTLNEPISVHMDLTPKPFLANLSGGYYVLDYGFEFTGSRPVSGERALHVNYIVNESPLYDVSVHAYYLQRMSLSRARQQLQAYPPITNVRPGKRASSTASTHDRPMRRKAMRSLSEIPDAIGARRGRTARRASEGAPSVQQTHSFRMFLPRCVEAAMCELPGLELIVADFSAVGVAFARDYRSDKRMLTKFTLVHPSVRQAFYVSSSGSSQ